MIHARPRIFLLTGVLPLALEKCLQSGENQASSTLPGGRCLRGSTSHTSTWKWSVVGWLSAWTLTAWAQWLMATSGERPSACSIPVEAPPAPAK